MIIPKESILNNLPVKQLEDKELVFIDSLIHTINIIDISYAKLLQCIGDETTDATELPMIYVWNIIDTGYRLRCLMHSPRVFKKNDVWYQARIRKLSESEKIRHFIQHYNSEVNNLSTTVKPLLGHLSWTEALGDEKFKIAAIIPGRVKQFKGLAVVNPAGKVLRDRLDLITFYIGTHSISVSDIYYQLEDFVKSADDYLRGDRFNNRQHKT